MAITFHIIGRKVPSGENKGQTLYYGQVRSNQLISFEKICEEVESRSTATFGDVTAVLKSMLTIIKESLEEGHIVDLGRLGRMRMSLSSEGVEEEEKMVVRQIRRVRPVFAPGFPLRRMLKEVPFMKIEPVVKYVDNSEPCPFPH